MGGTPTASFAVALEDRTSGAAAAAAGALESLRDKIDGDTRALREMQAAMSRLKGGTSTNIAAFKELRDRIAAQKASIAQAQSKFIELGGTFTGLPKKTSQAADGFESLAAAIQKMPGPLGQLGGRLSSVRSMLAGAGMAVGILAIAAALVALTAAAVGAVSALASYGVAQSDARRSELLRLEGLTHLRSRYRLVAGNAAEMQESIDRVSGSVSLGRGKLEEYTATLYRMGLRGANLDAALEGMALRGAVLGDEYARRFAGMSALAARTGHSVRALADDVRARLGGVAARQMLSLSVQSQKLRENVSRIFSGLRLDGFLAAVASITNMFSQSSAEGRALKAIFESLFQPIVNGATGVAPLVKRFFQGMIIGALELEGALLDVQIWFHRTFGSSTVNSVLSMNSAVNAGVFVFGALATGVGVTVLAFMAFGALIEEFVIAPMRKIGDGIDFLIRLWGALKQTVSDAATFWRPIGAQLVDGLIGGITAGFARARQAVTNLGTNIRDALRSVLDIHSPSRVFAQLGMQIPAGLAVGVDTGRPAAQRAVESMVRIPTLPTTGADQASSSAPTASRSVNVSVGDVHIHTQGDNARELAHSIRDELARVLEGVAIQIGAPT